MRSHLGLAALITCVLVASSGADTVRRMNLIDLSQGASTVISGRVVRVQEQVDANRMPIRLVSVRVDDVLKATDTRRRGAARAGRIYQFRQWNAPMLRRTHLRLPDYQPGEDVVLFLAGTSTLGLTSPLGIDQGKFTIRTIQKHQVKNRLVQNARDNANVSLVDPDFPPSPAELRAQQARVARLGLNSWEQLVLTRTSSGPLEYGRFVKLVKKLARHNGSRQGVAR